MQTYVYIDNFRGFVDAVVPIRQVNFLVGENSTGKTSFLELIEALSNMSFGYSNQDMECLAHSNDTFLIW